jgi:hypothetical protein
MTVTGMKQIYIAAYLAAIPVAAWVGLTAIDAQMGTAAVLMKGFFVPVADPGLQSALDHWSQSRWRLIDVLAMPVPLIVVFGGLPIALLAALFDRLRRQSATRWSLAFTHYSFFILQLLSTFLSGVWMALTVFSWDTWNVETVPFWFYFSLQFSAGVLTVPAWRRAFEHASSMRRDTCFLRDLRGKSLV